MITAFYRAPDGTVARPAGDAAFRECLARGEGVLWIDHESATRGEASALRDVFGFHQLAVDDCFNQHIDPAKVDDYGDYLFIIAVAIRLEDGGTRLDPTELDLFLGRNYVVSFHQEPLPFVEAMRHRCLEDGPELARGADFLAHALLDMLVDDYQPAVEQLDGALELIEERVLGRPEGDILHDILVLKRDVQRLRRTIIPQRDVVNRVARGEYPAIVRPETHIYFRDIYDHVVRVEQLTESLRELADGSLNTYLSAQNNRMNEVMKTLSVVASVILPLTFIASIYGMNFENMPELEWEYGYFMILAVMAVLGVGLVVFFKLRRWF
jgi:magnesium transporter